MLSLCRRHSRNCKKKNHFSIEELYRCGCPLMVMGMDRRGVYHNREALHTKDVYVAQETIRQIEAGKIVRPVRVDELTIAKAWERYKEILVTQRRLKPQSIRTIEVTEKSMLKYAEGLGVRYFKQVGVEFLEKWIGEWGIADSTHINRRCLIDRMFDAAVKRGWIQDNPTLMLMRPKPASPGGKTLPFELQVELPRIMGALGEWERVVARRRGKSVWGRNPRAAAALVLLLRLTGLRISDAFLFNPRSLVKRVVEGEEMYCYYAPKQKKTDHPVFIPFYPDEVRPILEVKWMSEEWAFWDGKTDLHTWGIKFHGACLRYLERASGVGNIHPHRFRDTFAVELLSKGVDIRAVSRLLGHKNPSTTLKYYEHYIQEDQDTLIRALRKGRGEGNRVGVIQFPRAEGM